VTLAASFAARLEYRRRAVSVNRPAQTRREARGSSETVTIELNTLDSDSHADLRNAVRELCRSFPDAYWRDLDSKRAYPDAFVRALTEAGYLATLIPEAYGGAGMGVTEASIILEEIHHSGGNAAACHAQMYIMGTLFRHGAEANLAKLLAADASWEAANVAVQTYGGFGFAEEYDVERKFRETRLYQVAPISTNLILSYVAKHVLGLPRSY
jgi:alkylation response protein AidB-like acyl-CoA dehydrogenase